jgi:hypothetical protein
VIYKVSYVVVGGSHPGAIINQDEPPEAGDHIQFDGGRFEITEVIELLPPHSGFTYLHATCEPTGEAT